MTVIQLRPGQDYPRFPRVLIRSDSHRRLLELIGVTIVDDLDDELAAAARQWLETVPTVGGDPDVRAAARAVRAALDMYDRRADDTAGR